MDLGLINRSWSNKFDFMYSWHDLSNFSEKIGRGFIVGGKRTDKGPSNLYSEKVPDLKFCYPFKWLKIFWQKRKILGGNILRNNIVSLALYKC